MMRFVVIVRKFYIGYYVLQYTEAITYNQQEEKIWQNACLVEKRLY